MKGVAERILDDLSTRYRAEEYPVLFRQYNEWKSLLPFSGKRLLDASPVFHNTCIKYAALLAGGAELHIARPGAMPYDPAALDYVHQCGIPIIDPAEVAEPYDVVLDCAGYLSGVPSVHGYVELTKSGECFYEGKDRPVFMVDRSLIKKIETCLGTGESFFRALDKLGATEWNEGGLLVIGYGKVGRGIVLYARERGIRVTVADIVRKQVPPGVGFVSVSNRQLFNRALMECSCAVTATGVSQALEGLVDSVVLARPFLQLANMGVEDEWGTSVPEERVLNHKAPLNFILDDPTRMCFIDPPMALHNAGVQELLGGGYPMGIVVPPAELESGILAVVRYSGSIPDTLLGFL